MVNAKKVSSLVFVLIPFALCIVYFATMGPKRPIAKIQGSEIYDWGTVLEGALISHDFILKNTGKKNLIVNKLNTSCGCTKAEIASTKIKPNEETIITVNYRGRPLTNREVIKTWVETNDLEKPITTLVITGKVELQVFWSPTAVSFFYNYGEIPEPKNVQIVTDLYDKIILEEISTSNEKISVSIIENTKGYACRVQPTSSCPKGNWTENIILRARVADYVREINIPVNLMIH